MWSITLVVYDSQCLGFKSQIFYTPVCTETLLSSGSHWFLSLHLYGISSFLPAQHVIWGRKFSFTHSNQFCLDELPGMAGACLSTCLLQHIATACRHPLKKAFSVIKIMSESRPSQSNNGQTGLDDYRALTVSLLGEAAACVEGVQEKGQEIKEITNLQLPEKTIHIAISSVLSLFFFYSVWSWKHILLPFILKGPKNIQYTRPYVRARCARWVWLIHILNSLSLHRSHILLSRQTGR